MPFAFIIVGIVLLVSGIRGSASSLVTLLKGDLTGSDNFIYWILAILAIGALGYIEDFKGLSRAFLALVLIVLVIVEDKGTSGGFFAEFTKGISSITGGSGSVVSSTLPSSNSGAAPSSAITGSQSEFDNFINQNFGGLQARPNS